MDDDYFGRSFFISARMERTPEGEGHIMALSALEYLLLGSADPDDPAKSSAYMEVIDEFSNSPKTPPQILFEFQTHPERLIRVQALMNLVQNQMQSPNNEVLGVPADELPEVLDGLSQCLNGLRYAQDNLNSAEEVTADMREMGMTVGDDLLGALDAEHFGLFEELISSKALRKRMREVLASQAETPDELLELLKKDYDERVSSLASANLHAAMDDGVRFAGASRKIIKILDRHKDGLEGTLLGLQLNRTIMDAETEGPEAHGLSEGELAMLREERSGLVRPGTAATICAGIVEVGALCHENMIGIRPYTALMNAYVALYGAVEGETRSREVNERVKRAGEFGENTINPEIRYQYRSLEINAAAVRALLAEREKHSLPHRISECVSGLLRKPPAAETPQTNKEKVR